jgi:hypothetical protein
MPYSAVVSWGKRGGCSGPISCADLLVLAAKVATQAAWKEVKVRIRRKPPLPPCVVFLGGGHLCLNLVCCEGGGQQMYHTRFGSICIIVLYYTRFSFHMAAAYAAGS